MIDYLMDPSIQRAPEVPMPTPLPTPRPSLEPSLSPTTAPTHAYERFGYALSSSQGNCEGDSDNQGDRSHATAASTHHTRLETAKDCAEAARLFGFTFFNSVHRSDRPGPGCCESVDKPIHAVLLP
jgi:hypothetical protein